MKTRNLKHLTKNHLTHVKQLAEIDADEVDEYMDKVSERYARRVNKGKHQTHGDKIGK